MASNIRIHIPQKPTPNPKPTLQHNPHRHIPRHHTQNHRSQILPQHTNTTHPPTYPKIPPTNPNQNHPTQHNPNNKQPKTNHTKPKTNLQYPNHHIRKLHNHKQPPNTTTQRPNQPYQPTHIKPRPPNMRPTPKQPQPPTPNPPYYYNYEGQITNDPRDKPITNQLYNIIITEALTIPSKPKIHITHQSYLAITNPNTLIVSVFAPNHILILHDPHIITKPYQQYTTLQEYLTCTTTPT